MTPEDLFIEAGIRFHIRSWMPAGAEKGLNPTFLLLHGLSSNARTWDQLAERLAKTGHRAAAVDQRGHGLSSKPQEGYDFPTITADLHKIIQQLGMQSLVLVGQSWGGNVLLEFAAKYPAQAQGYVFVDGGFLHLHERGPWERIEVELRPPDLAGLPRAVIEDHIRTAHPGWGPEGIQGTLGNFEVLPDQTVRPWLSLEHHLEILRAMYDQDPPALFSRIQEPVLICAADDGSERMPAKRKQVQAAAEGIAHAQVLWFPNSAHDIHVDQPDRLADAILEFSAQLESPAAV